MSDKSDNARVDRILRRAKTDVAARDIVSFMIARIWIAFMEFAAILFKRARSGTKS